MKLFALAIGQSLVIPDGVVPDVKPWSPTSSLARVMTPDAGSVSATGSWILAKLQEVLHRDSILGIKG